MDLFFIILIAIFVSFACSLIGAHLVLRQKAMLIDSITHTVLLGIVLGYFIVGDISSPFLILAAALMGIVTVFLTEALYNTGLVKRDASIGLIFPLLFSSAIILITKFMKNSHVDTDSVLLGKIEFAVFDKFYIGNIDLGPKSLWIMGVIFVINLVFLLLYYKELLITSFDPDFAKITGFSPIITGYMLMALVSITTVGSFQAVGSILVISFMVGPIVIGYFLTEDFKHMILYSFIAGIFNSVFGVFVAIWFDLSIAGTIASMMGLTFVLIVIFDRKNGVLGKLYQEYKKRREYFEINVLFHIAYHRKKSEESLECDINTIDKHFNVDRKKVEKTINNLMKKGEISEKDGFLDITQKGKIRIEPYEYLMEY